MNLSNMKKLALKFIRLLKIVTNSDKRGFDITTNSDIIIVRGGEHE